MIIRIMLLLLTTYVGVQAANLSAASVESVPISDIDNSLSSVLEKIYVDSFLPHIKDYTFANDPMLKHIHSKLVPAMLENYVVGQIRASLEQGWKTKIETLNTE